MLQRNAPPATDHLFVFHYKHPSVVQQITDRYFIIA
ncbi:hypothetical protein F0726_01039 [Acidithiobacillus caldus]|nr:hypothetical protein F0726_01039 [Acidithiobacillus caldus]